MSTSARIPSHLFRRSGVIYFRFSIPKPLRPVVGLSEIRQSLQTTSLSLATELTSGVSNSLKRLLNQIKMKATMEKEFTPDVARQVVKDFVRGLIEETKRNRILYSQKEFDWEGHVSNLACRYEQALNQRKYEVISDRIVEILKERGVEEPDIKSFEFKQMCHDALFNSQYFFAWATATKRHEVFDEQAEWCKYFPEDCQPLATQAQPTPSAAQTTDKENQKLLLKDLMEKYVADKFRRGDWRERTYRNCKAPLDLLVDLYGELPIEKVGMEQSIEFVEILANYPRDAKKKKQYKGLTPREIAKMDHDKLMAPTTQKKYLQQVTTFITWVLKNYDIDQRNHFANRQVNIDKMEDKEDSRRAWTNEEVSTLFSPELFPKDDIPRNFWVPVIALFSGARCGEITQLMTEDIYMEDDVWLMDLNTNHGKTLKNPQSKRRIPIHNRLIQLGLLDHVNRVTSKGKTKLFEETAKDAAKYPGKQVSAHYTQYLKDNRYNGKGICLHGLRNTFSTTATEAGVSSDLRLRFAGQKIGNINDDTYANKISVKALKEMVADHVDFPFLDFDRLKTIAANLKP